MTAQDLLHRTLEVVVAKHTEDALKIGKGQLMRLEKRLRCGMSVSPMVGRTTGHRPHLEDLQLDALATQNRPGLIPIHLRFRAPRIALWYEYFAMFQSQLLPPALHLAANTSFTPTEAGDLGLEPIEYTTCRMPLLRRCRNFRSQNLIDELRCRVQLPKSSLLGLGRCWLCAAQRLSHHPPV